MELSNKVRLVIYIIARAKLISDRNSYTTTYEMVDSSEYYSHLGLCFHLRDASMKYASIVTNIYDFEEILSQRPNVNHNNIALDSYSSNRIYWFDDNNVEGYNSRLKVLNNAIKKLST